MLVARYLAIIVEYIIFLTNEVYISLFMIKSPSLKVEKWISGEELKKQIRKKEKDVKVLNRLHFINHLYDGCSIPEASEKLGITKTGYIWFEI